MRLWNHRAPAGPCWACPPFGWLWAAAMSGACAQGFVDQSFLPPDSMVRLDTQVGIAPFMAGAQTFTPQIAGQLAGMTFSIRALGGAPLTAQLRVGIETTTTAGRPSGQSLGEVALSPSVLDDAPAYTFVPMASAGIFLTAGERYAAVFRAVPYVPGGSAAYNFRGYSGSFLGGDFSYGDGQGFFSEDHREWQAYAGADFDYVFSTHMVVPEPSTTPLVGFGAVVGAGGRWIQRRRAGGLPQTTGVA